MMSSGRPALTEASFWSPDDPPRSAWRSHIPFAFWLVEAVRPRRAVDLGTTDGACFFALCQAMDRLGLPSTATAVVDPGAPSSARDGVSRSMDQRAVRYPALAEVINAAPDAAASRFDDRTIDLLHIDGLHGGGDLRGTFEAWRPKLADAAVLLLHGTHAGSGRHGAMALFQDLAADCPSFLFEHGRGLGVVCPAGAVPQGMRSLLDSGADAAAATKAAYGALGAGVVESGRSDALRDGIAALLRRDGDAPPDASAGAPDDALILDRLGARLAEAGLRSAAAGPAVPPPDGLLDLLRRSLRARLRQLDELRRGRDGAPDGAALARAALRGRLDRAERDRLAAAARHDELLRWGQGAKARVDALAARLDAEIRARAEADARLEELGRSRLVRASRGLRRLLGRGEAAFGSAVGSGHGGGPGAGDIRDTGLFDEGFYRGTNPDLAGVDAARHFTEMGWWEGRRPNPTFDPLYYLAANEDVRLAGMNPLVHYAERGIVEGRRPNHAPAEARWSRAADEPLSADEEAAVAAVADTGLFDALFYLSENPDIGATGVDPLVHYALEGWREGRRPNPGFDPAFYLEAYDDVRGSGEDPLVHYAGDGIVEGRLPSRDAGLAPPPTPSEGDAEQRLAAAYRATGLFDADFYRATYPDVAAAGSDALLHFVRSGLEEGRRPNPFFDPRYYRDANPDVRDAGLDPLLHFADVGILEGRLPAAPGYEASQSEYARWVEAHDTLTEADRRAIRARLTRLDYKPLISVILPVYDTPVRFLRAAIGSVQSQLYENWELCVADDASPNGAVRDVLRELARKDPRIKVTFRPENGHISASSNSAIALATGEFLALLDHDDVLPDHALFEVVACLNRRRDLDVIYSDEDHLDPSGQRKQPYFKADYDPELLIGHNMISHFGVYRTSVVRELGGFRLGFEGSQDYDLALRVIDATTPEKICHIPAVLYHWRSMEGGDTFSQTYQDRCVASAQRALVEHLARRGEAGDIVAHPLIPTWHRVRRPVPDPAPLVSIIVPTKDKAEVLGPCCDGILARTDYPSFELIVVDHQSTEPDTLALLDRLAQDPRVRILPYAGDFNYSAINNAAVEAAKGSVLAFLNNDVEVIEGDWLAEMVSVACRPGIGAVGAKLLYPDGRIQHVGVVLGSGGVAGHAFLQVEGENLGDSGRAVLTMTVSAVTAACLVVKRELFDAVGGFDADNLPVAFNDVDLCLKIRALGVRNVMTPHAMLYHHESVSRGQDESPDKQARFKRECDFMVEKWGDELSSDPFYNPNLSLTSSTYTLAWPPRRDKPWGRAA